MYLVLGSLFRVKPTRNNKQQTLLCQGFGRVKQRTTNKEQETKNVKSILFTYIAVLILLAVLPINGTNSILNNNYLLNIRWDYLLHALVYIPLVPLIIIAQIKQGGMYSRTAVRLYRSKH